MKGLKVFLLFLFLAVLFQAYGEQPALSLITVYPGDAIYSAFGHTAFRYVDTDNRIDALYNFGTFDFRDPKFVPKFVQGQLDYFLGVVNFKREFLFYTQIENRTVVEQHLNLTQEEISKIHAYLTENALPENRFYKYDFIKDNCSTRIQAVLDGTLGDDICYDQAVIAQIGEKTYREYIRKHLGGIPWYDVGIQLVLGMPLDQTVLPSDSFFLPALVEEIIENSTLSDGRHLVDSTEVLYRSSTDPINDPLIDLLNDPKEINQPFLIFSLLLALELGLIYLSCIRKNTAFRHVLTVYEYSLAVANFLMGMLIFYLWFISDHTATKGNLNILWCSPLTIVYLSAALRKKKTSLLMWDCRIQTSLCILFILIMLTGIEETCAPAIPLILLYTVLFGRRVIPNLS